MEILTEIIIHSQSLPVPLPPVLNRFPWNFRRVSLQWRDIVDRNSIIWTSLEFNLADDTLPSHPLHTYNWFDVPVPSPADSIYMGSLRPESFALSRGMDRPLTLALNFGGDFENVSPGKIYALLPIILAHSRRIQHITFQGPPIAFQCLPTLTNNTFPILQSFHALNDSWAPYDHYLPRGAVSEIAPRLSHIKLPYNIAFSQLNVDFPTLSLTTLWLPTTQLSSQQILAFLSSRPHLARLAITSYDNSLDPTPLAMVPPLSRLVQLSITVDDWREPRWLSYVELPSLNHYHAASTTSRSWFARIYLDMPPRVKELTTLILDLQVSPGHVWDLLNSAQCLESFEARSGAPFTQKLLTALAEHSLSPCLRSLGCVILPYRNEEVWTSTYSDDGGYCPRDPADRYPDNRGDSPFSQLSAHLDMLERRAENSTVAKITKLKITQPTWDQPGFPSFSTLPRLQSMVNDGWSISVKS